MCDSTALVFQKSVSRKVEYAISVQTKVGVNSE